MLLIHDGLAQADLAPVCPEDEIAQAIDGCAVHAIERQRDGLGIGAGGDHEVVFELPLVAVIDQIHAGVDVPILDLRVRGNVGAPLLGIIADEVAAFARQLTDPGHRWHGVGPDEPNPQYVAPERFAPLPLCRGWPAGDVAGAPALAQDQDGLGRGQEERIAPASGEELDLGIGLTVVSLEAQR